MARVYQRHWQTSNGEPRSAWVSPWTDPGQMGGQGFRAPPIWQTPESRIARHDGRERAIQGSPAASAALPSAVAAFLNWLN
jgi:hypothetical protein